MSCACHSGIGDADALRSLGEGRRFPAVEKVLAQYIAQELKAGNFFYISEELNSKTLAPIRPYADDLLASAGVGLGFLGFLAPVLGAITGAAATVGATAIKLAPAIAATAGSVAAIKQINAINNANKAAKVQVPTSIAAPVAQAIKQDVTGAGISSGTLLLIAAGFGALLLMRR